MNSQHLPITPKIVVQLLIVVVLIPLLPLLLSGRWNWWEAWVYALIYGGGFVISRLLAAKKHPDIIAERARMMDQAGVKSWDKILAPALAFGGVFIMAVAGLDERYNWSSAFDMSLKIAALLVILAGYVLGSYALIENRYFSGVVRIQTDRNHHVVSSGPYRWMRHPGYAGALLTYLGTPVFLDSLWAFIPAVVLVGILLLRTQLEDTTLQNELEGYRDYTRQVHYRLLPGLW